VVKQLLAVFWDRLRYTFRNFPSPVLRPNPHHAAEAAEAAGAQNRFWEMHDLPCDHQPALSDKHLSCMALGLASTWNASIKT
jgi:protein-disulfide isomerase